MDISFIVPVYNTRVADFRRCVDSISKIDEKINYEIIVVDDGSQKDISEKYKNIIISSKNTKYIWKNNSGVSETRNCGLMKATGKYIAFVDSDDEIIASAYKQNHLEGEMDLIIYDMQVKEHNKYVTWKALDKNQGKIELNDVILRIVNSDSLNGPVAKLFKRSVVVNEQIHFDKNLIVAEDLDYLIKFLGGAKSIYYVPQLSYVYYRLQNKNSKRIIKFKEKIVNNYMYINHRKLNMIESCHISIKGELVDKVNKQTIDDLFSVTCDYIIARQLKDETKKLIVTGIMECKLNKRFLKSKLKKNLIVRKKWILIFILATARQFYLKSGIYINNYAERKKKGL